MKRVFLDSSVIIAGIASHKGASHLILQLSKKKKITAYISSLVLTEALRNLKKKFPPAKTKEFFTFLPQSNLQKIELIAEEEVTKFKDITHEKDVHVIAGASIAQVDHLITLDKRHLLSLKNHGLPFDIINPKDFLSVLAVSKG